MDASGVDEVALLEGVGELVEVDVERGERPCGGVAVEFPRKFEVAVPLSASEAGGEDLCPVFGAFDLLFESEQEPVSGELHGTGSSAGSRECSEPIGGVEGCGQFAAWVHVGIEAHPDAFRGRGRLGLRIEGAPVQRGVLRLRRCAGRVR